MNKRWPLWIVTLGGAGLLRPAPGTWGSLAATVVLYGLHCLIKAQAPADALRWMWPTLLTAGILLLGTCNVLLGPWIVAHFGRKDPGQCVVDEGAGICLTLLFLPDARLLLTFLLAFAAFRLFDVLKPPPARQLEHLPGGWGILMDDLAAALYANITAHLILRLVA